MPLKPTSRPCANPACKSSVDLRKEKDSIFCCRACYQAHRKANPVKQAKSIVRQERCGSRSVGICY